MTSPGLLNDALEVARSHIIDRSSPDLGGQLALQHAAFAVARIHAIEILAGLPISARCIVAPDSSPSRNPQRSAGGYSTGGELWWARDHEILPLDTLPNCCGIALAEIAHDETPATYYERLLDLADDPPAIDGIRVVVDLNRKNHFLGTYRDTVNGQHYAAIHCSAPEFRSNSPTGFGLNRYDDIALARAATTTDTVIGPITHLEGAKNQARYLETHALATRYAQRKRADILAHVFGDAQIVTDRQHQGYAQPNHIVLGAQLHDPHSDEYPYLLGADQELHIIKRVEEPAQSELDLALVPHGTGYTYATEYRDGIVSFDQGRFRYTLTTAQGRRAITGSLDHLPAIDRAAPERSDQFVTAKRLELVTNYRLPN